ELIVRSAEMVRPLLEEKGIKVRLDTGSAPVMAVCDNDKMVQVMTNLLGNAIKFTPAGKTVTLRLSLDGEGSGQRVSVSVIDEGIGIPEEEKELIVDSFHQGSRTNTGAGGTGLGLAICRSIVEAHNGKIWADNNKDSQG